MVKFDLGMNVGSVENPFFLCTNFMVLPIGAHGPFNPIDHMSLLNKPTPPPQ